MRLGIILGDQLSQHVATLRALDKQLDLILMAEVAEEATYVQHHQHKIALVFSAMRHFAQELRYQGWQVVYFPFDASDKHNSLLDALRSTCSNNDVSHVVVTQCGEYRLQQQIDTQWCQQLNLPLTCLEDDRFICSMDQFKHWASHKKQLRMEYFYRQMRQQTGLLMQAGKPQGGKYNFDAENRKKYQGDPEVKQHPHIKYDAIDEDVFNLVSRHFAEHPGDISDFHWATTRAQALDVLSHFIRNKLAHFGDYQDALSEQHDFLFHAVISPYINIGLLDPMEVCQAAEKAYYQEQVPLNCAEGFIRQIIGWREYVRGIYWLTMPDYAEHNKLDAHASLPKFYWHGNTEMRCMRACFNNTFKHAYAHHIQRLMVTGNFALLAGISPKQVCEWYLAVYADAFEWVELPNTLGMVLHADEGLLGSKPYAASGKYIQRMSDHCSSCSYNVKTTEEPDSCPFNALYWHFIHRQAERFENHPRMAMIYRNWHRFNESKQQKILSRAEDLLANINHL